MSDVIDWYQRVLSDTGRAPALWALIGFLLTFALTRGITRRIRRKQAEPKPPAEGSGLKDVYIGGVHVHHQVWGIFLVLITGLLEFRFNPPGPWSELLAALFGAGAALTLDEFALWFHLDDVYWSTEGRKSIDAILIGGAVGMVLLFAASPVGETRGNETLWGYMVTLAFHLALAGICFLKGKLATGMIGIVVPFVAIVGAIRLAKPQSVWSKRRYKGKKLARAHRRFDGRYLARHERLRNLIGGGVSQAPATEPAATGEIAPARADELGDSTIEIGGLGWPDSPDQKPRGLSPAAENRPAEGTQWRSGRPGRGPSQSGSPSRPPNREPSAWPRANLDR